MQLSMDHQKWKKQTDSLNATENLLFSDHFRNEFLKNIIAGIKNQHYSSLPWKKRCFVIKSIHSQRGTSSLNQFNGFFLLNQLLENDDYNWKLDLNGVYFSVQFVQFPKVILASLSFLWLASSPRLFTKLTKLKKYFCWEG